MQKRMSKYYTRLMSHFEHVCLELSWLKLSLVGSKVRTDVSGCELSMVTISEVLNSVQQFRSVKC